MRNATRVKKMVIFADKNDVYGINLFERIHCHKIESREIDISMIFHCTGLSIAEIENL